MRYLTPQEVLFIHARLIAETGGSHGVRDLGLVAAAVARPQATFDGRELYADVFAKAGALMESLIQNHAFLDGNKRTGITAAGIFLRLNGQHLEVDNTTLESFTLSVAKGERTSAAIADWLRRHCRAG
jgi:death-on-curing protein